MFGAYVHEDGQSIEVIIEIDDQGNPVEGINIPFAAIASRRELLGIDDPAEVVEAIREYTESGYPDSDPVTGEHPFTEAMQLLRLREQAREDAALEVKEHEGYTDHQVQVAAAQMAYRAVHQPIGGGECALDRCRREARNKLGVPDPGKKCGVETRTAAPPALEPQPRAFMAMRPPGGKTQVLDCLAGTEEHLLECTKAFLHSLTDHDADPLEPDTDTTPEPGVRILTADEILAKYQEAH